MDYQQGLCSSQELYRRKLEVLRIPDPYAIPQEKWKDDVASSGFGQIYTYLIDTPGQFTKEKLKAYKSLDAFNYYKYLHDLIISGWVQAVHIYEHGLICLMKSKVKASQQLNDKPHEAWIAVERASGTVLSGHCTCMAG